MQSVLIHSSDVSVLKILNVLGGVCVPESVCVYCVHLVTFEHLLVSCCVGAGN